MEEARFKLVSPRQTATDTKKPDRAGYAKGASKEGAASDEKFDPSKGFDDFAESAEKRANCFSRMVRACWERMLVWRDVPRG